MTKNRNPIRGSARVVSGTGESRGHRNPTLSAMRFSGVKELDVDTLYGEIKVEGYSGSEVQVEVNPNHPPENQTAMDRAKRDVSSMSRTPTDSPSFYVDGPFRATAENTTAAGAGTMTTSIQGRYDFNVKVPRAVNWICARSTMRA